MALSFDDLVPKPAAAAPPVSFHDLVPKAKPKGPVSFGDLLPKFMSNAAFAGDLDRSLGEGRWRDTGDYRTPGREAQLRAQGAATARGTSRHSIGAPDAPGAHDIVPVGLSTADATARLRRTPGVKDVIAEGPAGGQGAHLHVDVAPGVTPPAPKPVSFDDLVPKAKPKPVSFADLVPPKGANPKAKPDQPGLLGRAGRYLGEEVSSQIMDPLRQVGADLATPKGGPAKPSGPMDLVRGAGRTLKLGKDIGAAALDVAGAPIHAAVVRPAATAAAKVGLGDERTNEGIIGTALMGLGPEARAGRGGAGAAAAAAEAPRASSGIPRRAAASAGSLDARESVAGPKTLTKPPTPVDRARDTGRAIQSVFSPETTAAGRPVAHVIRRSRGEHQLLADQAEHQMVQHSRVVDKLPVDQRLALIDHIEHRGDAGRLDALSPQVRATVDTVGKVYDRARSQIGYVLGDSEEGGPSFIRDYYSHLWQQPPQEVADTMRTFSGRQGSGRSLKQRTIPTIREGMDAGLTPVTTNPLEATSLYVQNMYRYLTTHDVINHLRKADIAKFYVPGKQPEGWRPLEGIGTTRNAIASEDGTVVQPRQLFAPSDAAGVYNSYAGRGFEGGKYAPAYRGLRKFTNSATMLKLGLSAYHASTMTVEAAASAAARAATQASRGELLSAGKTLATQAPGISVVKAFARGRRLEKEVLGIKTPDSISGAVNQAFTRSGGQLRMDPIYRARGSGSFYNAIKKGTFKTALRDAGKRIFTGSAWDRAKGTLDLAANVIQSTSAPLFEDIIPNIKRGVFADSMADFLKANPEATQEEIDRMSIKLQDSMDNRFGEMIQDNIFWERHAKQSLQLALLSPSWNIGTVRELAGGIVDLPQSLKGIATGKGLTPRTAYVVGLAYTVATINAVTQYLMTGKPPQSATDLMAGQTGGVSSSGAGRYTEAYPERLAIPGNQKDVFAFVNAVSQGSPGLLAEGENKINPAWSSTGALLSNSDWRGDPVYTPPGVPKEPGDPTLLGALKQQYEPISFEMMGQRHKGTAIPSWATFMGARPSPEYLAAPGVYRDQRVARERRRLDQKRKHDDTAKERLAP